MKQSKSAERLSSRLADYDQASELQGEESVIRDALETIKPRLALDNVPYLGKPFLMKDDDPDQKRPQPKNVHHVKIFDLTDDEQLAEYTAIIQRAEFGKSSIVDVERKYNEVKDKFTVYLHWRDLYYVSPDMADDDRVVLAEAAAYLAEHK